MKSVVILGTGLIGRTIAADLCNRYNVTCADLSTTALQQVSKKIPVKTVELDFTDTQALIALIEPYDLVIGAVPGFLGYNVLANIIKAGKNCVDISFFPENPFRLDQKAKENKVTAVVDCGIAPGMCNVFAGFHFARTKISLYECLVGGLPVSRELPYEYKAVFSPADVIEEYTRPATYILRGRKIKVEALSEAENIYFKGIGHLEAFCTDGLRTLELTLKGVQDMKEKTLRYPGHAALMKIFRDAGFFSKQPICFRNTTVSPLEMTSKLLFPQWEMKPGEKDFTVMRVTIEDESKRYVYAMTDHCDQESFTSSMARTTGYTCAAAATLVLENKFSQHGICPPEYIGADESCFTEMLQYLDRRNVKFEVTCTTKQETINA